MTPSNPDRREPSPTTEPDGCRYCDEPQRGHGRLPAEPVGWHAWAAPTDEQRKARMLARRARMLSARAKAAEPAMSPAAELRAAAAKALKPQHLKGAAAALRGPLAVLLEYAAVHREAGEQAAAEVGIAVEKIDDLTPLALAVARAINGRRTPLDILGDAVRAEGGDWTTQRAADVLDGAFPNAGKPTAERARQLLNQLAEEGLLVKHGPRGRLWTPAERESDYEPDARPPS